MPRLLFLCIVFFLIIILVVAFVTYQLSVPLLNLSFFCPFLKQPLMYQVRARIDHAHFCVSISHSNCPPVLCFTPIHHTHLNDIIPSANVNLTPDPFCLLPSVLLKIAADNGVTNITLKQRFLD